MDSLWNSLSNTVRTKTKKKIYGEGFLENRSTETRIGLRKSGYSETSLLDFEFQVENGLIKKSTLNYIFFKQFSLVHAYKP